MAANTVSPATSDPRTIDIQIMVMRALRASGRRKTLTPLEMASVPVSAEPPDENAFSMMNTLAPSSSPDPLWPIGTVGLDGVPTLLIGWAVRAPVSSLYAPTAIMSTMLAMKK